MRSKTIPKFFLLVILILLLLFPHTEGLAQSSFHVAVHYVEGVPAADRSSYDVTVYLSVVDGSGSAIRGLTGDAFMVNEDSQKVEIQSVGMVEDEPINIVLVIDTSGSMSGIGINDAKATVKTFVSTLKPNDQVAMITFDDSVKTQSDFTTDRKVLTDRVDLISVTRDAGTCMYDAAYAAIEMASTLASGSRALILLTDGKDETKTGAICSIHTVDDVINLASGGATRTPIYTLGMGNQIDGNILKRISDVTGGLYLHSSESSQLANVFQQLSDQLRSQYVLTYKSFASTGPHSLNVSVNQFGEQAIDARNFVLPPLPSQIVFLTPHEGDTIANSLSLGVTLSSQGELVERVDFEVNGAVVGSDDTTPYELEVDMTQYPEGIVSISAIAYGTNNTELTRNSLNLIHSASVLEPATVVPTEVIVVTPTTVPLTIRPIVFVGVGLGGLGILTIAFLILMLMSQQRQEKARAEAVELDDDLFIRPQRITPFENVHEPPKARTEATVSDALGTLTVESSDDAAMIGHYFVILSQITTLGRSADNDIDFPKDNPVSRRHIEIFEKGGKLYLKQVETADSAGEAKLPKYGTLVNTSIVGKDPVILKHGDVITLGKRLRLKFEVGEKLSTVEGRTFDEMTVDDDPDRTQAQ